MRKATFPLALMICLWGTRLLAVDLNSRTSAITYATADGVQHVWLFATSATNLYAASSDANWTWMDLGQPPSGRGISVSSAITYRDRSGGQVFAVFVTTDDGHLLVNAKSYLPGSVWQWQDLGVPEGAYSVDDPMAITYVDAAGITQVRVFVDGPTVAGVRLLFAAAWYNFDWQWFQLGTLWPARDFRSPSAVSYHDRFGDHSRVFVASDIDHLLGAAWDGGWTWTWYDLTQTNPLRIVAPKPVAYVDYDGYAQIQVFALARNGHLVLDAWYGYFWSWSDLGRAPTASAIQSDPMPISWSSFGINGVEVFLTTEDGHLFADTWDDDSWEWRWFDMGLGMGTTAVRDPTPISYWTASGVMNVLVFAQGSNGNVLVDVWDGTSWNWNDLGQP